MKDPQKIVAAKLAAELAAGTSADILRLKRRLTAQEDSNAAAALSSPTQSSGLDDERPVHIRDGWVGIWEPAPHRGDAAFTRSAEFADEWALWAKQPVIPPKSNARRIVLLGESVARGFLYDPVYTPAQSLAAMLTASPLPWQTEVVDLARTSLQAADLIRLLHASVRLQPDAILVFAGNNWCEDSRPRTIEECQAAATTLRKDGVAGLRRHLEDGLEHLVESYARQFEEFARATRIPVVFLIPEFNLEDWRPEDPCLAPLLDAIGDALEEAGAPDNPDLQRLLIEEHSVVRQQHINLLDATYAPSWSHPDWYLFHHWSNAAQRHYYRAHTPESQFVFVADANTPLRLRLTVRGIADRLPVRDALMLDVNGSKLASINLEASWRTHTLAVPGTLLKPGMNTIRIRWPDGGSGGFPGELEAAANWLESGCFPSLLTPYGEIHSMTISGTFHKPS